ncbi:MAG: tRNA pseudouridine(38-40) synthase TruA [Desulfovibrio sp.]|jgi:tRNA pseudouridine38-40 synthase|nr:tRNA pseudouridine(38-40) synthase TruA [Desulfovibrio sp.]
MRLKLLLAYIGTRYSGWQIQEKPNPPRTVQAELEAALQAVTGARIRVCASGRTDAGTHAKGQTAHCDVPDVRARLDWRRSLNALLPRDIRVIEAERINDGFHARNDVARKTYAYQFWQEKRFLPPELSPFVWDCGPLDLDAMRSALPHLSGEQDFAALQNAGADTRSTYRTIFSAKITQMPLLEHYPPHSPLLRLTVSANGFLKQMVRNMAGLLADCGRKRIAPESVTELLAARERKALSSATAPARGLTLLRVEYGE